MERHKALSAGLHTPFTLRMHRSLSWLKRAEAAGSDDDVAFICLWIAFNAAYAQDTGSTDITSERQTFRDFVGQVCHLDADKALSALVYGKAVQVEPYEQDRYDRLVARLWIVSIILVVTALASLKVR